MTGFRLAHPDEIAARIALAGGAPKRQIGQRKNLMYEAKIILLSGNYHMGEVELLSSHRLRRSEEIVGDIVYALQCLGGAAHVTLLTSAVEAKLRDEKGDGFRSIAGDIHSALHAFDVDNADRRQPALFRRPFGAQSQRWALYESAPQITLELMTAMAAE